MKFQTFGNHDTEIVIIPWVMTWDGVVTEFHNSYRRQLGISDRMEAQLQRIVLQQSHNFVLRELGVAATGITCECDPARKRQAANMDRGPPLKEREGTKRTELGGGGDGTSQLTKAVNNLTRTAGVTEINSKITITEPLIDNLATGLANFIGYQSPGSSNGIGTEGIAVGKDGKPGQPLDPNTQGSSKGYRLTYDRSHTTWTNSFGSGDTYKAAKIFMGCIPLYYNALSYLYWRCSDKGGEWSDQRFSSTGINTDLKDFMVGMGFKSTELNVSQGKTVMATIANTLQEFSGISDKTSYPAFLKSLPTSSSGTLQQYPLSSLHLLASAYFQHHRSNNPNPSRNPPSTIRQMLHWLSGLAITPNFGELLDHINSMFPSGPISVAISGSLEQNEKLSSDDLAGHLITSCISSSWFLGTIQGPGDSNNPHMHEIYSSSEFSYPSSPSVLLSKLADYAYALQFQLHFLYQQCSNTYTLGCGWRDCRFGKDINAAGKGVQSHICQGYNCVGNKDCKHDGQNGPTSCKHNKAWDDASCGHSNGAPSPLQAFLTDCIDGMCRQHPGSSYHLATCSGGSLCHVPMGFAGKLRTDACAGLNVAYALGSFCGGFNTPLRQLSEKLGCLTKRTPRTLGDLFGFTWHLNGQLFGNTKPSIEQFAAKLYKPFESSGGVHNIPQFLLGILKTLSTSSSASQSPSVLSRSLEAMAPAIPFLYQLFMAKDPTALPVTLFNLKSTDHKNTSQYQGNHNDLYSLYYPQCTGNPCGPYLYPLTHSDGATYAPTHASTYLSWLAYLTDDFHEWFQNLLDEFKNIDCSKTGCMGTKCKSHAPGTHGNPSSCDCESVVHCGGTLPLLYRHGFRYNNPAVLMGGSNGNGDKKRSCHQFAQQLQKVISTEAPLDNLLNTIDTFLYAIRWEFFSKLSGFWTIYVCIILYTFFFLLDTLRVRSHLHFPSSNSIAPISLLGTGKAPALTKSTKLTYFIP
ncbi:variant erythrocyte surface antigen-1 family protein [Babesia caballi]|uniref:Variant erythrocyte surface antigen-1 family protein n=1 Tax=Babesia caballi TaxID=5871 RepID=A0AAV4LS06_BABCB|nr:variant erythrocyte surface antigen-1 family protein [Babesia caballi]